MDSLRDVLNKNKKTKAERRGSIFVTVLILLMLGVSGVFYIKNQKPELFSAAVECIKSAAGITKPQPQSQPEGGRMLRAATDFELENCNVL